jgi:hypothetical protein
MLTSYHMINFILPERCAADTAVFAESVESKRRRWPCGSAERTEAGRKPERMAHTAL